MVSLQLNKVSLEFSVRVSGAMPLKEFLIRGMFRKKVNPLIRIPALVDLDLDLREGDRLGVLGHNGAGKSTLLKVLSGVYPITQGSRNVEGRISSLFDVAHGFEPEATGWENIRFRSYLQGETPRSIDAKMKEIGEFTELGQHLDMPLRLYSTGMIVRLGFAIATAVEPEILLVDEILQAGDLAFQKKAAKRIQSLFHGAGIVVYASHDMSAIQRHCNRVLWLDHGKMRMIGDPDEVVERYRSESPSLHSHVA